MTFYKIYHRKNMGLTPMIIVGDHNYVIDHIWNTSKTIGGLEPDLDVVTTNYHVLDYGGPLVVKIPYYTFDVYGNKFSVQYSRINSVMWLLAAGGSYERVPDYVRTPINREFLILPVFIHRALIDKLQEESMSDKALHAEVDEYEILNGLRNKEE